MARVPKQLQEEVAAVERAIEKECRRVRSKAPPAPYELTPGLKLHGDTIDGHSIGHYAVEGREETLLISFGGKAANGEKWRVFVPAGADWREVAIWTITSERPPVAGTVTRSANEWCPRLGYLARALPLGGGQVQLTVRELLADGQTEGRLLLQDTPMESDDLEALALAACDVHAQEQVDDRNVPDLVLDDLVLGPPTLTEKGTRRILPPRSPSSGYQKLRCPSCDALARMTYRHLKKGLPYCGPCTDLSLAHGGELIRFVLDKEAP
jgi:hypothetical protein